MAQVDSKAIVTVMLAVPNTPAAAAWYEKAFGANILWSLGSVAALEIEGAAFLLHEPVPGKFESPQQLGAITARVELFVDAPDAVIARAVEAGATGGEIQNHQAPWGTHRQGSCIDPFGHQWNISDKSPLQRFRVS